MVRVRLVLGAGGIVGQAYQAGVLAALDVGLGWDARDADVIVGSSAGSVTGAALRLGVPAPDLAAWAVDERPSADGNALLEAIGARPDLPPFAVTNVLRPWRLPSLALLARAARRPWAIRPSVAALTMLPSGPVDLASHASVLDGLTDGWPDGLWICTARRRDGQRVVFGRPGTAAVPLSAAVAASCAIPGYFSPVRIDGVEYFDGGVHSPTNADVLRRELLDLVVVVSPMSAAHGRAAAPDGPVRWAAHTRLEREIRRLQQAGIEVVRFEPGRRTVAAMGVNAMADDDRIARVIREAYVDAGEYAATARVAARLAALATRRPAAA